MRDIVKRLFVRYNSASGSELDCEAANEIERLRRDLVEEARRNMEQTGQLVELAEQRRVEIERLLEAIEQDRKAMRALNVDTDRVLAENEQLRSRLAEAEVLLHDWREQWGDGAQPSGDLIDGTDAFLAASSASVPVPVSFFRGGHHVSHVCENCGEIWIKHIQGGRCPAPADSATRQESDAHG